MLAHLADQDRAEDQTEAPADPSRQHRSDADQDDSLAAVLRQAGSATVFRLWRAGDTRLRSRSRGSAPSASRIAVTPRTRRTRSERSPPGCFLPTGTPLRPRHRSEESRTGTGSASSVRRGRRWLRQASGPESGMVPLPAFLQRDLRRSWRVNTTMVSITFCTEPR